jgi:hypothetical protein
MAHGGGHSIDAGFTWPDGVAPGAGCAWAQGGGHDDCVLPLDWAWSGHGGGHDGCGREAGQDVTPDGVVPEPGAGSGCGCGSGWGSGCG